MLEHSLDTLSDEDGARLLYRLGVRRSGASHIDENDTELRQASLELGGHALALTLLGNIYVWHTKEMYVSGTA